MLTVVNKMNKCGETTLIKPESLVQTQTATHLQRLSSALSTMKLNANDNRSHRHIRDRQAINLFQKHASTARPYATQSSSAKPLRSGSACLLKIICLDYVYDL